MKNNRHHYNMDLPPSLLDASWRDDDDVSSCVDSTDYQLNLNARSSTNSGPATKLSNNKLDTFFIATNIIFIFVLIFVWFNAPCHEGYDTNIHDISINKPDMSTQFQDTLNILKAFEQPGMFITRGKGIWQVMLHDDDGKNIQEIKRYLTMPSLEEASEFIKEEMLRRASVDKPK